MRFYGRRVLKKMNLTQPFHGWRSYYILFSGSEQGIGSRNVELGDS